MSAISRKDREPFSILNTHPVAQRPFLNLRDRMAKERFTEGGKDFLLMPFEGYRHPERQNHLFSVEKTTKARPYESAHQYGLALDFAGRWITHENVIGAWFWPDSTHKCWDELKRRAAIEGLDVPIIWDRGHVQHPLWRDVRHAFNKREWNWIA